MSVHRGVAGLCSVVWGIAAAQASPWGQPRGDLFTVEKFDQFTADGPGRQFEQHSTETYFELGLGHQWMVGGKLAGGTQTQSLDESTPHQTKGIFAAEVFLQRQIFAGEKWTSAATVTYAAETSVTSLSTGNVNGQDAAVEIGLGVGRGGEKTFGSGQFSVRRSLGGDADQLKSQWTLGRHYGQFLFLADAYTTTSFGDVRENGIDYDAITVALSSAVRVRQNMRVQLGVARDIHGRGVDEGERVFIALWISP